MENEKKNAPAREEQNSHNKGNRPRRRGYFIEPPTAQDADKSKHAPSSSPNASSKGNASHSNEKNERKPSESQADRTQRQGQAPTQSGVKEGQSNNGAPHKSRHKRKKSKGNPSNNNNNNKPALSESADNARQASQSQAKEAGRATVGGGRRDGGSVNHRSKNNKGSKSADVLTPMPVPSKKPLRAEADDEYEEVALPSLDDPIDAPALSQKEDESPLVEVVGIRFKSSGKTYYFAPGGNTVKKGDFAIVETARGREYGEVSMGNSMVKESQTVPPLRPIIRIATAADHAHHEENKRLEEEAFRICNQKISEHGLDMKLIDAQYTFDNFKLLFYFTSAGRVDFRVLVKDLASAFRTRIELRQIGIRDEAKLLGGIGMCGRPLCCSRFLSDFGQVSIKMAKEQNLSLNSAKISGICGRLMCCLRYEHKTYEYEIKRTPGVDSVVRTCDGNGIVTEANPLVGTIKVRLLASPDVAPKVYRREDVVLLRKKKDASDSGHQGQK